MNIDRLIIENFRIFVGRYEFVFTDKKLILIGGQNGHGKSSLFDAIEWCITNVLSRYKGSSEYQKFNYLINDSVFSSYNHDSSYASVEIWLKNGSRVEKIKRKINRKKDITVLVNDEEYGVREGGKKISEILFRQQVDNTEDEVNENVKNLPGYFSTTQFLSQDQLHEFIRTNNPQDRFSLMEKVLGLDTYGEELQKYLLEALQVIKEKKETKETEIAALDNKLSDILIRMNEKEKTLERLGIIEENSLINDINQYISELEEDYVSRALSSFFTNLKTVDESVLDKLHEIRNPIVRKKEENQEVTLLATKAMELAGVHNFYDESVSEKEKYELQKVVIKTKKRREAITKAKKFKSEIDSLELKRKKFIDEQKKIVDMQEQCDLLERKVESLKKEPDVNHVILNFNGLKEFISYYLNLEDKANAIINEIRFKENEIEEEHLKKELNKLDKELNDTKNKRIEKETSLKAIDDELKILEKQIEGRKLSTVDQLIHELRLSLMQEESKFDICPICEKTFNDENDFRLAVVRMMNKATSEFSQMEKTLVTLQSKRGSTSRELEIDDLKIKALNLKIFDKNEMYKAIEILIKELLLEIDIEKVNQKTLLELKQEKEDTNELLLKNNRTFTLVKHIEETENKLIELKDSRNSLEKLNNEQNSYTGELSAYFEKQEKLNNRKQRLERFIVASTRQVSELVRKEIDLKDHLINFNNKKTEFRQKIDSIIQIHPNFENSIGGLQVLKEKLFNDSNFLDSQIQKMQDFIQKVEGLLTNNELIQVRKESESVESKVKVKRNELQEQETLEIQLGLLRDRHTNLRSDIMKNYLAEYSEKIDQLFMQINPHAIFKHVNLITSQNKLFVLMGKHKNNVEDSIDLNEEQIFEKFNASLTFSSAQANSLAVCIFLSLALSQNWTSLNTIGIDDPFQNMDDINVFSFVDIVSQILSEKQVIISSHSDNLISLMKNKSGLDSDQIGYIHFKSYSLEKVEIENNCI